MKRTIELPVELDERLETYLQYSGESVSSVLQRALKKELAAWDSASEPKLTPLLALAGFCDAPKMSEEDSVPIEDRYILKTRDSRDI